MCKWIKKELGADVPLHFSAFHPDYKMADIPATPQATLIRARDIALKQGLHYVYTGNVHHIEGDTTFCPSCLSPLIVRDWYQINQYRLTEDGHCPDCGKAIAGKFDKAAGNFGANRIPVRISQATA
jgi:pyruvate formate lyase activating enzyme